MSRNAVGEVYARVISDVYDKSRDDFEMGGVDLGTLDLLKSKWQDKLSSLKVAHLPWDPVPPAPAPTPSHTLPSNARPPPQTLPSNGNPIATPSSTSSTPGPQIKQEAAPLPPLHPQGIQYQMPVDYAPGVPMNARQRAAAALHQNFGSQAAQQIAQLRQGNMPRIPVPQPPMNMVKQEEQKPPMSSLPDYGAMPPRSPVTPIKSSQNDGASEALSDWREEAARRRQLAAHHCGEADRLMRDQFLDTQARLEGGGSMLPRDEHLRSRGDRRRNSQSDGQDASSLTRAQGDAPGDDERVELDEDAINSDLDDPDDIGGDEQDEEVDQVMLCTYDKVQRVKNKWKCTLKDGVLKVQGSEYVFHKGQGEFEW